MCVFFINFPGIIYFKEKGDMSPLLGDVRSSFLQMFFVTKISQTSQENTCAEVSFLIKLPTTGLQLL